MHEMIRATKLPFPESLIKAREVAEHAEQGREVDELFICARALFPSLRRTIDQAAEGEARLRCAEAALALERFRQKNHGAIPDTLAGLVPGIEPHLPIDPIDGAPLRYRKLDPAYLIYSIGVDGMEEGGTRTARTDNSGVQKWLVTSSVGQSAEQRPDETVGDRRRITAKSPSLGLAVER
jgi:hypothetical protein